MANSTTKTNSLHSRKSFSSVSVHSTSSSSSSFTENTFIPNNLTKFNQYELSLIDYYKKQQRVDKWLKNPFFKTFVTVSTLGIIPTGDGEDDEIDE